MVLSWDCPKCVASLGKKSSLLDWFLSSLGKKSELAKGRVPRQLDLCHSFIQYEKRIFEIAWHFHLSQRSRSASTWWRQSRSLRQPNPRRDITDKWHGLPIWPFSEQVCEFQKENGSRLTDIHVLKDLPQKAKVKQQRNFTNLEQMDEQIDKTKLMMMKHMKSMDSCWLPNLPSELLTATAFPQWGFAPGTTTCLSFKVETNNLVSLHITMNLG